MFKKKKELLIVCSSCLYCHAHAKLRVILVRSEVGAGRTDFTQAAGRGPKGTGIAFGVVQCQGELTPCALCSILKVKYLT